MLNGLFFQPGAHNVQISQEFREARELDVTHLTIRTSEGPTTGRFRMLDETGVLVLLDHASPYHAGTVFIPNRDLAKRSPNKTTHMAYQGLYEAFRGGKHTVRRAGGVPRAGRGEVQELAEDVETARSYVRVLLLSGALTEEEAEVFRHAERALIERLRTKRNDHKVTAREQFLRGMQQRDRLGRYNPAAAGFVTGAAIGHLLARKEDVRRITARVDKRTIAVYSDLERHMELYDELRAALKPNPSNEAFDQRDPFLRLGFLLDPVRHRAATSMAISIMSGFVESFKLVKALPFRKNAANTVRDLEEAIAMANVFDRDGLERQFKRLRKGIAWVYAQRRLECEVIAPLAFLLDELSRSEENGRRAHGKRRYGPGRFCRDMAPERFARIEDAWKTFDKQLKGYSDEGLKHPIKQRVQEQLALAHLAAGRDAWEDAKRYLKAASGHM